MGDAQGNLFLKIKFSLKLDYLVTKRQNNLITGQYGPCEGKDAANYTLTALYTEDATCSLESTQNTGNTVYLTACQQNGQKVVNILSLLTASAYPAGGEIHFKQV